MRKTGVSRDRGPDHRVWPLDVLLSGLPKVTAPPTGERLAPIIDKAKRPSYLTANPVQRRENGRHGLFRAFCCWRRPDASDVGKTPRFSVTDGIGKIENAQLGSEVRLSYEEGLRLVQ